MRQRKPIKKDYDVWIYPITFDYDMLLRYKQNIVNNRTINNESTISRTTAIESSAMESSLFEVITLQTFTDSSNNHLLEDIQNTCTICDTFEFFKIYVTKCFAESSTVKLSTALNLIADTTIPELPTVSNIDDLKRTWKSRLNITYNIVKNINSNTAVELDLYVPVISGQTMIQ
ncbi:hypothetical protein BDC45DRAFT_557884 [Circinella umbellata]|nr:hypothetical protein BDC45DRAFT_557884 [Circinella umbellata]